ncbi:flagellar motor protein MotB [bacterium]|nr:flagellar motor protein MotB [bacterium]
MSLFLPSYDSSAPRESSGRKRDTRWLLSFADLITLLLAVAAMTLTTSGASSKSFSSATEELPPAGLGTGIAQSEVFGESDTVYLFAADLEEGVDRVPRLQDKQLILQEKCRGSCVYEIEVMSCSRKESGATWHRSLTQLLTVHRHFFDGVSQSPPLLRMVSLGEECGLLGYPGRSADLPLMAVRYRERSMVSDG